MIRRRSPETSRRDHRAHRSFRHARLEWLEPRLVLSAPTLAPIQNVTVAAGAPLPIALDGFDLDGDTLTFSVTSTNAALESSIVQGNRSLRISVEGMDDMAFQLFEQQAPHTTARIIALAESDFYDGLIFHRVADYTDGTPFVIQGGDPDGDGSGGSGVQFDDEFNPGLQFTTAGILAMANGGDDTNDSQFFITGSSARHLDFNHSIFGFLVEGDDVRQAIQNVATDSNSKPLTDVVMESVDVFYDHENGVLMLSAAAGATGEANVTVTADDGHGGTASRMFHVTIAADTDPSANANPYLDPVPDVHTTMNTPVTFTLPGVDVEGDYIFYAGQVYPTNANLDMYVSGIDGQVMITPKNDLVGVYAAYFGVRAGDSSTWDTQAVPVFIAPAAPTGIELLAGSDSGFSPADRITHHNNRSSADADVLRFQISGVLDGAEITLLADGNVIGAGIANGDTITIATDGNLALADGTHTFTATQTLRNQTVDVGNRHETVDLASQASAAVHVTVDVTAPQITSQPIVKADEGVAYVYDVAATGESGGNVRYRLTTAPTGMTIDEYTGLIRWTPESVADASYPVVVVASDLAGNEVQQAFSVDVNLAPEIQPVSDKVVVENSRLTFAVSASDPDGPLTYSLAANAPVGAAIDAQSGEFSWTPSEAQGPGAYQIAVRVTDAVGALAAKTFSVQVAEVNEPPSLQPIADRTVDEGEWISFVAGATDVDLPASPLAFRLGDGAPAGASIDPSTGQFRWRPSEAQGGDMYAIPVEVRDSAGASAEQSFTVTVNEVDSPPVFDAVRRQVVLQGAKLEVNVAARDPDLPTNAVTYSLDPDAPTDMRIDAATGKITWDVPEDHPAGEIPVSVRATEVVAPGRTAQSSLLVMQVEVVDFGAILAEMFLSRGAAHSRSSSDEQSDSSPENSTPLVDPLLLEALAAEAFSTPGRTGRNTLAFETPPIVGSGVERDLFGVRIGPDTGSGGMVQPAEGQQNAKGDTETSDVKKASFETQQPTGQDSKSQQQDPPAKTNDAALLKYLDDSGTSQAEEEGASKDSQPADKAPSDKPAK